MIEEGQVEQSLNDVIVPAIKRSVIDLNLVRDITISDDKVGVVLASAALNEGMQEMVKARTAETLKKLPGINSVEVSFIGSSPNTVHLIIITLTEIRSACRKLDWGRI